MIKLRPYQKEAVEKALHFFENGDIKNRPIIVAPTGAGKSIVVGHTANTLKYDVLVLQPSKELLDQNYQKFKMYGGSASIYSASFNSKEVGIVTFATIGSVVKKADLFQHIKYIIIDECHLVPPKKVSMYVSFLSQIQHAKVIGLTATAFRLKTYRDPFSGMPFSQINILTRERPRFFNDFLHVTQISELYDQGYLSPIKYISLSWDSGTLKINSTGAEYSDESIKKALSDQKIHERLPSIISQSIEKGRKHRIVFVKNVSDAESLARRVPDSACVSAETPKKEREQMLKDFKSGKIKTIFNVNVLTIGFDFPALDTIILARPTMSLALYMQMIGRGVRTADGKKDCVVVDLCGNIERFGQFEKITYGVDPKGQPMIHDGTKILSGVRLA